MLSALEKTYPALVACVLMVGAIPREAHAQGDFNAALSAAVQLYQDLEYEQALEQLQKARRLARGNEQEVTVYLYEGIFLGEMGQPEDSVNSFSKALTLNPEAQLPITVSPKLQKPFDELRAKAIAAREREARERKGSGDRPELSTPPDLNPRARTDAVSVGSTEEVRAGSRVPVAPVVLGSVGVVAAGVGIVFGLQSRSNASKVRDAYSGGLPSSTEVGALGARLDDAHGQARTANILFGAAALAAGGAALTWLLNSHEPGPKSGGEQ